MTQRPQKHIPWWPAIDLAITSVALVVMGVVVLIAP